MAEDSDLERTEAPTGRRLEQAREQGQVPQSRELSSFLVLMASAAVLWFFGAWMFGRIELMARDGLSIGGADLATSASLTERLAALSMQALIALAPLLGLALIAALMTPFLLNAWVFSPKALAPNFARMDPLKGLGRIFSLQGLAELVKALLKSLLIGGVAVWLIWSRSAELAGLLSEPLESGVWHAGGLVVYCFLVIVAVMVLIVAADVPFQLWRYHEQLKMTKEEVRQEGKEMEGSPEVKGRIRQLQREAARRRMMAAVPKADVIVTNPTHFAVALAYKAGMAAPKVVAKGRGEVALRIRETGAEAGVPMLEAPPLARALYRWSEVDESIPVRLYAAVAEVLAYVYQLDTYRKTGGRYPMPPRNLDVPPELDPGIANG
jgi:flagellar biosynthetic protein FlhB